MSRFRTRKLEESGGHGHGLGLGLCPLEEGRHGLGRHLVADRRVGPAAVVISLDELDHRVLGGVPGREAPSAVHLVLQRREERFRHSVVVAVAGAAAGQPHVVVARPLGQKPAGVLGAAVGVEYRVAGHVAARFGRRQRRNHDVRRHSLGERPAHHHAGAQVDDRREVQPPLAGAQVGDVAHELVGWNGAGEVAAHQVGPGPRLGIRDRGALPRVGRAPAYPQLAHQFAHPVQGEAGELAGQEALHEPEAEPAVRLQPHAPDRLALGRPVFSRAAVGEP